MANTNARFGTKAATLRSESGRPPFRPTALAAAVAIALVPAYARADEWSRNIEITGTAGSNDNSQGGVAILQPLMQDEDSLTYVDLRAIFADHSTHEFNLGVGHRLLRNNRILGGYLAYDWRKTGTHNKYKQVTFGAESLGDTWDFRANYYLPVGDKKNVEGVVNTGGNFIGHGLFFDGIVEESMEGYDAEVGARIHSSPYETRVYAGGYHFKADSTNREANGPKLRLEVLPRKNIGVELSWQDDNLFGSQTALKLRYSFGGPSGEGVRTVSERMTQLVERDADIKETSELGWRDQVSSEDRVNVAPSGGVIHVDNSASPVGADGSDEHPFTNFDDATVAGNLPGDTLVHVHAGDGPYTEDVTLSDGTLLLGETIGTLTHLTDPFNGHPRDFFLDPSEVGTDNPVMYGNGADAAPGDVMDAIVTLADDNEVAGFDFIGGEGGGYGSQFVGVGGSNTSGADIHDNTFTSFASFDTSILLVANNSGTFTGNWIHDNAIYGGGDGIAIYSNAGPGETITQSVTIEDNDISYGSGTGILIENKATGYDGSAASSTQTVVVSGNDITGGEGFYSFDNGIVATNYANSYGGDNANAVQTLTLTNNDISFIDGDGIAIYNKAYAYSGAGIATATQTATLTDNDISNVSGQGVQIRNEAYAYYGGGTANATQTATLTGNSISETGGEGVYIYNNAYAYDGVANAIQTVTLASNTITDTGDDGVEIYNRSYAYSDGNASVATATQNVTLTGNTITDIGDDGVDIYNHAYAYGSDAVATANQTVTLTNNIISDVDSYGVYANNFAYGEEGGLATANQTITLTGNTFGDADVDTDFGSGAVWASNQAYGDDGGTGVANQTLTLTNNTFRDVYGDGVYAYNQAGSDFVLGSTGTATQNVTLTGNTFTNIGDDGVYATNYAYNNATATQNLTLTGNTFTNIGDDGVHVSNEADSDGDAYVATAIQTVTLTSNTIGIDAGVVGVVDPGDGVGGYGVYLWNEASGGVDNTASQTVVLTGNSIVLPGSDGVWAGNEAQDGAAATQNLTLTSNTVTGAGDEGVYLRNDAGDAGSVATQIALFTSNAVTGADSDGFRFDNDGYNSGTAVQTLTLTSNTATASDDDGFDIQNNAYNGGTATQTATLTSNIATGSGDEGFEIDNDAYNGGTASQTLTLTGNTATGSDDDGFDINNDADGGYAGAATATQTGSLSGNTASTNGGNGIEIDNEAYNSGIAGQTLTLADNIVSGNGIGAYGGSGIYATNYAEDLGAATQTLTLTGNVVSASATHGMNFENDGYNTGTATQTVSVTGGSLNNLVLNDDLPPVLEPTGSDGISATNTATGIAGTQTQNITISGLTVTGFGEDGIDLNNLAEDTGTAVQTIVISDTTLSGNISDGVEIENDALDTGTATQTATITTTTASGNSDDGFDIRNEGAGATQTVSLGGTASGNLDNGVEVRNDVSSVGTAEQDVDIGPFTFTDNDDGLSINNNATGGGTADQDVNLDDALVSFTGTTGRTVDIQNTYAGSTATQVVDLEDVLGLDADDSITANGVTSQTITDPDGVTTVDTPLP